MWLRVSHLSLIRVSLQLMAENGNHLAKRKYEAVVPVYYYKPTHKDCR